MTDVNDEIKELKKLIMQSYQPGFVPPAKNTEQKETEIKKDDDLAVEEVPIPDSAKDPDIVHAIENGMAGKEDNSIDAQYDEVNSLYKAMIRDEIAKKDNLENPDDPFPEDRETPDATEKPESAFKGEPNAEKASKKHEAQRRYEQGQRLTEDIPDMQTGKRPKRAPFRENQQKALASIMDENIRRRVIPHRGVPDRFSTSVISHRRGKDENISEYLNRGAKKFGDRKLPDLPEDVFPGTVEAEQIRQPQRDRLAQAYDEWFDQDAAERIMTEMAIEAQRLKNSKKLNRERRGRPGESLSSYQDIMSAKPVPEFDDAGNQVLDENGQPKMRMPFAPNMKGRESTYDQGRFGMSRKTRRGPQEDDNIVYGRALHFGMEPPRYNSQLKLKVEPDGTPTGYDQQTLEEFKAEHPEFAALERDDILHHDQFYPKHRIDRAFNPKTGSMDDYVRHYTDDWTRKRTGSTDAREVLIGSYDEYGDDLGEQIDISEKYRPEGWPDDDPDNDPVKQANIEELRERIREADPQGASLYEKIQQEMNSKHRGYFLKPSRKGGFNVYPKEKRPFYQYDVKHWSELPENQTVPIPEDLVERKKLAMQYPGAPIDDWLVSRNKAQRNRQNEISRGTQEASRRLSEIMGTAPQKFSTKNPLNAQPEAREYQQALRAGEKSVNDELRRARMLSQRPAETDEAKKLEEQKLLERESREKKFGALVNPNEPFPEGNTHEENPRNPFPEDEKQTLAQQALARLRGGANPFGRQAAQLRGVPKKEESAVTPEQRLAEAEAKAKQFAQPERSPEETEQQKQMIREQVAERDRKERAQRDWLNREVVPTPEQSPGKTGIDKLKDAMKHLVPEVPQENIPPEEVEDYDDSKQIRSGYANLDAEEAYLDALALKISGGDVPDKVAAIVYKLRDELSAEMKRVRMRQKQEPGYKGNIPKLIEQLNQMYNQYGNK